MRMCKRLMPAFAALWLVALAACDQDEEPARTGEAAEQPEDDGPAAETDDGTPEASGRADAPPEPDGPVGVIEGRIVLSGEAPERVPLQRGSDPVCAQSDMLTESVVTGDDGGLKDVFVRVDGGDEDLRAPAPDGPVVVDQEACMYRPRVQGAVTGQTLRVKNSDSTLHNVRGREMTLGGTVGSTLYNLAQPAGAPAIEQGVGDVDVVELGCDMHAWMQAFVVVSDHPYFATTGEQGRFRIENVPTGSFELSTWHPHYGEKREEITVEEAATVEIEITYDAEADDPA